ncbi:MAG: DNA-directed RNA polymerase subunit omega [Thermoguttaceae bacterium]|nr:DNA-directed RNA polymerase subunit omega [Thermoguttaceae bacterium]
MYNELREEEIVQKVGGRFKLSTLIQKRMTALNRGGRPLVDLKTDDKMAIIIAEIMQDKIFLDTNNEIKTADDVHGEDILADMGIEDFH